MPHLALYRKYRSQNFSELAGQEHVIKTLSNAVKNKRLSHAYLFSGPRGVGKTSVARILAAQINNLTPTEAQNHLDIIEIDAASNRKIDEIRDLREKVHLAPSQAPYKVYIIDEVHMLTTEAFNALLKTLEEPPAHVIFILATTDLYKLPPTIVSRTQHFQFEPISVGVATKHLAAVAKSENIKIEPEALQLISEASEGSLRDGLSVLDQLALGKDHVITANKVREILGWTDLGELTRLAHSVLSGDAKETLDVYTNLNNKGAAGPQLLKQLMQLYLQAIHALLGITETPAALKDICKNYSVDRIRSVLDTLANVIPSSPYFSTELEAALLGICLDYGNAQNAADTEPEIVPITQTVDAPKEKKSEPKKQKPATKIANHEDAWLKILMEVKKSNNSLYALLRSAEASITDSKLQIRFRFQFHAKRMQEGVNRQLVDKAVRSVLGKPLELDIGVAVVNSAPTSNNDAVRQDKEAVDSVLQILGGEVVQ